MRVELHTRDGFRVARLGGEFRKVESGRFFAGVADTLNRRPGNFLFNLEEIETLTPLVFTGLERFGRILSDRKFRYGFVVTPEQERELVEQGDALVHVVRRLFRSEAQALRSLA